LRTPNDLRLESGIPEMPAETPRKPAVRSVLPKGVEKTLALISAEAARTAQSRSLEFPDLAKLISAQPYSDPAILQLIATDSVRVDGPQVNSLNH